MSNIDKSTEIASESKKTSHEGVCQGDDEKYYQNAQASSFDTAWAEGDDDLFLDDDFHGFF